MKILGIETSCDETAVCIVDAQGTNEAPRFKVLGNALYSQIKIHAEFGGVFPMMAKREHAKNLVPLFEQALKQSGLYIERSEALSQEQTTEIKSILEREPELADMLIPLLSSMQKPDIDLIAVTAGPGLEPALWVGINFALALGKFWNIPVMPTNHMEGHIVSPLLQAQHLDNNTQSRSDSSVKFPAVALLISGGHTELVLVKGWSDYQKIGQTRDDAVGEAFDKVARILSLPYPGGPEISKLAERGRIDHVVPHVKLPRPMIKTDDFDFSFSGIKTAVLYTVRDILKKALDKDPHVHPDTSPTEAQKIEIALEFENAVTEVLLTKTQKALDIYGAKTLIIGGGVIANSHIRSSFEKLATCYADLKLLLPDHDLSTDNAVMIAVAGYFDHLAGKKTQTLIKAHGNLSL